MQWLIVAIAHTLALLFTCSLFEAVVLSTTVAEIEALKKSRPHRGAALEIIKVEMDETISAILTLNTVASGVGSVIVGYLAAQVYGNSALVVVTPVFAVVLLIGSEVLPKNIGVVYRRTLQPYVVYPLIWLRRVLTPVTWACNLIVRLFVRQPAQLPGSEEEIRLLAERGAQEGILSRSESNIIANALSLDDVRVSAIMTPRTVVMTLSRAMAVSEVLKEFPTLPFGRIPVYGRNLDDIVGIARRRDLLKAKANDQDTVQVGELMNEVQFVPETVTVAAALQVFLKTHQQMLITVDEFGSTAGVLTMEDVIEHLLGREIFEKDDIAVDMRELARSRQQQASRAMRRPVPGIKAAPPRT
jgi:CBS domain containing-hemolysin-like protein